jgi:hypothetical protein
MASEMITPPAESSLAIRNDSGTARSEGLQNLVGQWKETSALLNKRDVIIGVSPTFHYRLLETTL